MVFKPFFVNVRLNINNAGIMSLTQERGSVFNFTHKVVREAAAIARVRAPFRTGELMRSIEGKRPVATGPFDVEGRVYAHVPYAKFVHEGTAPWIFPHGRAMHLPEWGAWPEIVATMVRGQSANRFMKRALTLALRRNGIHIGAG